MAAERFPVEAGHIMMFARSIGDDNPVYYDAEHEAAVAAGGILAPPTFVQASAQYDPDYPLRPRIGEAWIGSGATASGVPRDGGGGGGGLHAEQHFTYHRPLRAGAVLHVSTSEGATWEKHSQRSGRLVFREHITEYRDADGNLVITARSVGVKTEKVVDR
jgi:acyl dehydratase